MEETALFRQDDVARTFSALAAGWSKKNTRVRTSDGVRNRLIELLPSILNPSSKLLDVGCGDGKVASLLRKQGIENEIFMIDGAEGMANYARERFQEDDKAYVEHRHLEDFVCLSKRKFNVISALQVLHHVADLQAFLQTARQALEPGGQVVALTVGEQFHKEAIPFVRSARDPFGRRSAREWVNAFESAGFFTTTVVEDYFDVEFQSRADYASYLRSIGSASKMKLYRADESSDVQDMVEDTGALIELTGHHVTIVARRM